MKDYLRPSVRAAIAIGSLAATVVFMLVGTDIPDAWWAIVSSSVTFYFVAPKPRGK